MGGCKFAPPSKLLVVKRGVCSHKRGTCGPDHMTMSICAQSRREPVDPVLGGGQVNRSGGRGKYMRGGVGGGGQKLLCTHTPLSPTIINFFCNNW